MQEIWHRKNLELLIWVVALAYLAFADPASHHFTICPLGALGFDFCPGCGLGHSVSWLFRGEIMHSLNSHPLGSFAILMILYRIGTLTYRLIKPYTYKTTNYSHE